MRSATARLLVLNLGLLAAQQLRESNGDESGKMQEVTPPSTSVPCFGKNKKMSKALLMRHCKKLCFDAKRIMNELSSSKTFSHPFHGWIIYILDCRYNE
jgi:hypothetical protein